MCTVLLPPGGYPIAVKYIISYYIIDQVHRITTLIEKWLGVIVCRCHCVQVSLCAGVIVCRCHCVQVSLCAGVIVCSCHCVQVSLCASVIVCRCHCVQVSLSVTPNNNKKSNNLHCYCQTVTLCQSGSTCSLRHDWSVRRYITIWNLLYIPANQIRKHS